MKKTGVRETSIATFQRIKDEGLLSRRRLEVYTALFEFGPATANELFRQMKGSIRVSQANIKPRIGELVEQGVVRETQQRACQVTGNVVLEYDVTPNLPLVLAPRQPSKLKRVNPEVLAQELKEALLIGPMSQITERLDRVFQARLGVSFKAIHVAPKKRTT